MALSIAARARHWPDRTAIVDDADGTHLTYAEFADRIDRTASRLAAAGIGPGDRVVSLSRSRPELLSVLCAAALRGATIAPVSHRLPPETVATLCARIEPELVLVESGFTDLAGAVDAPQTGFALFSDGTATSHPAEAGPSESRPETTAGDDRHAGRQDEVAPLLLHTGGTTGTPKLVPISRRQLEWNAITESVAWGFDDRTVSVPVLPMFHTGGWNLITLPTLYAGGTIVMRPEFDPGAVLRCIEEYGVTQLFAVPAILRALAEHPSFADTDLSSVEWFMSGGGPCPGSVIESYRDRGETFLQGYGLTEGGPNNLYRSPERAQATEKPDSVGRPFPDCEARLVDADGNALHGEATGELELAGPVTADGYLATEDGTFDGGWVSTGDIARRDEDGDYYIVGRTDNMFVSGGENVYPEAIEESLERHDAVEAAAVTPIAHERWGQVPKAVVVGTVSEAELAAYSREHLADFQLPHEFEFVDAVPETGAGKLDRDTLASRYGG